MTSPDIQKAPKVRGKRQTPGKGFVRRERSWGGREGPATLGWRIFKCAKRLLSTRGGNDERGDLGEMR